MKSIAPHLLQLLPLAAGRGPGPSRGARPVKFFLCTAAPCLRPSGVGCAVGAVEGTGRQAPALHSRLLDVSCVQEEIVFREPSIGLHRQHLV